MVKNSEIYCNKCGAKISQDSEYCPKCGAHVGKMGHAKKNLVEREWYIFAYLLEFISGIVIYFTKGQEDKRLLFHSVQAIIIGIIVLVLSAIIFPIAWLIAVLGWVYCMYIGIEAYNGRDVDVPIISNVASSMSNYKSTKS